MDIPKQVGIMTLPNAILFPQALLPLYIFEPRYRTMLKKSLENQRMFAIAMPDATSQPRRIAGIGLIRACVDRPDGTSNLLLQGISRVRFTDFVQEEPYYVAKVEPLKTEEVDSVEGDALAEKVLEILKKMQQKGKIGSGATMKYLTELKNYDMLADIVTYSFLEDITLKQELLETLDLRQRLRKVVLALQSLLTE
jgi:Lon protease-like protein